MKTEKHYYIYYHRDGHAAAYTLRFRRRDACAALGPYDNAWPLARAAGWRVAKVRLVEVTP